MKPPVVFFVPILSRSLAKHCETLKTRGLAVATPQLTAPSDRLYTALVFQRPAAFESHTDGWFEEPRGARRLNQFHPPIFQILQQRLKNQ